MGDAMHNYFAPQWCDEQGNTYYPYILKGTVTDDGYSVRVEAPEDFKANWPTIATSFVAYSDDMNPRRLSSEEVRRIVALGRRTVREELGLDG